MSYVELAKLYCDAKEMDVRRQKLLKLEGEIVTSLPVLDYRMH
ncbi:hypothetical protein GCM10023185_23090 [Hymenobacter saemangeumensis]|uniref:Uncharacterized protein n=1 Tax=Hymenobacter saemangeumensis TaxID=1084522 RepID=A0ABP8IGG3_9BACT